MDENFSPIGEVFTTLRRNLGFFGTPSYARK